MPGWSTGAWESEPCIRRDAEEVVAIGDLHGNYAGLISILRGLELIDGEDHWCGGKTHVVQMGDVLGRGGEPGKIFALFMRLEREAAAAAGGMHLLLGNHEVLSIRGTLVYNTPAEFQDIADAGPTAFGAVTPSPDWTPVPSAGLPGTVPSAAPSEPAPSGEAQAKYQRRLAMMGCDSFQRYLHPTGPIGAWLLSHPTAMILGDTLFVHGGLNREHGLIDLAILNREVSDEIEAAAQGREWGHRLVKNGPQWNREYALKAMSDRPKGERGAGHKAHGEKQAELDEVLAFHGCARMVVGHTPTGTITPLRTGEVLPLYEEKLWCVDTGIGHAYGGYLSALCLRGSEARAAYPG
jgi:Calcineurin-like phosphoesterase